MAKETKKAAQERVFENYRRNYNAIPDYTAFQNSITTLKDKSLFTEQSFKKYYFKQFDGTVPKDMIKLLKEGGIKYGDLVIQTLKVQGNKITAQQFGCPRNETITVIEFCKDWKLSAGKTLSNKKTGLDVLKDFTFDAGMWGKRHFFISNEFGNHVRYSDAYLNQFVETAKLRKTYSVH